MARVVLAGVGKQYDDGVRAVHDVDLEVADGELLVLVGPSGCGKSTILRMIAGLEELTAGSLHIGDRDVTKLPPKQRDVAMVFQSFALYPHMTVAENLGFSLRLAKVPKDEIDRRVREVAAVLDLVDELDRRPPVLSGGQQQRVAMGRAIVRRPSAWLMDEPLSNLDARLRVQMRAEIADLQHRFAMTTVFVTHDQVEAMTMGDRVAVLRDGALMQVAPPQELYERPDNLFVAAFLGSPGMNLFSGVLERDGPGWAVEVGAGRITLGPESVARHPGLAARAGAPVAVGIRPEHLRPASRDGDGGLLPGTFEVALVELLGAEVLVHLATDLARVDHAQVRSGGAFDRSGAAAGERLVLRVTPGDAPRVGSRIGVAADVDALHLFDPVTGQALRAAQA